jgi:hypothetical protein
MPNPISHVQPGDLITAADWNDVVDTLADVLTRLGALEAGSQQLTGLAIEQVVPDGPYRIGDTLKIVGRNFQYSIGAATVFVGPTQVLNLLPTSSDTMLQFVIPSVPGVIEAGTSLDLIVLNHSDTKSVPIVLKPKLTSTVGNVVVTWASVDKATFQPGDTVTFQYTIRSGTNNRATWTLSPVIDVAANAAAWNAQLKMVDDQGKEITTGQIDLDPGEQRTVGVQITKVPDGTANVQFGLTLNVSTDGISGTSGVSLFKVGVTTAPPDTSITLNLVAALSGGALSGNTLTVAGGGSSRMAVSAELTIAGTYNMKRGVLGTAQGWSFDLDSGTGDSLDITAADLAATGKATRLLRYKVSATGTADTPAQIQLTVTRSGQTSAAAKAVNVVRA